MKLTPDIKTITILCLIMTRSSFNQINKYQKIFFLGHFGRQLSYNGTKLGIGKIARVTGKINLASVFQICSYTVCQRLWPLWPWLQIRHAHVYICHNVDASFYTARAVFWCLCLTKKISLLKNQTNQLNKQTKFCYQFFLLWRLRSLIHTVLKYYLKIIDFCYWTES